MKLKFSSTSVLFIALASLSAWYFLYEKTYKQKRSDRDSQQSSLLPFDKDSVTELMITTKGEAPVHLKKGTGNDWILVAPLTDKADKQTVSSLLASIGSARKERVVEENPKDLSPFGLVNPELKLTVVKDLENQVELLLGSQTQVGSSVYVKLASSPPVIKTNKSLVNALTKNLFELRDKNLISLARDSATELELEFGGKKTLFLKNAEGKWMLGRASFPVDSSRWLQLENRVFGLKAKAIYSESSDPKTLALFQAPRVILKLKETPEGKKELLSISQLENKVLAKVEGRNPIYEIDPEVLKELTQPEENYRDKHLLSFDKSKVVRIKISHQGKKFDLAKEKDRWRFEPDSKELVVDPEKVESFLSNIKELKAEEFLSNQALLQITSAIELLDTNQNLLGGIELGPMNKGFTRGKSNFQKSPWNLSQKSFDKLNFKQDDFVQKKEITDDSVTH